MISPDVVLVRYGEIAQKERWTRSSLEHILAANIAFDLKKAGIEQKVSRAGGRIVVQTRDPRAPESISRIFGVTFASPAVATRPEIAEISKATSELARDFSPRSFAIRPWHSSGHISSEEMCAVVGDAVRDSTGASIDLKDPELEIFIEARSDKAYIFTEVIKGIGGRPLGSQAKMMALISGDVCSSVAAWMMMKKGCAASLLHFDWPHADSATLALRSAEALASWASGRKVNFIQVPIARGIEAISSQDKGMACILCKRLMYRTAMEIMKLENCSGIVTGCSLGEASSQTAESIMAEQTGIDVPIYHPLIAMEPSEIADLGARIGLSCGREHAKPCPAAPQGQAVTPKPGEILRQEEEIELKELARELASEMSIIKV
jgi:thiamine biosynthesis protein ThiI